MAYCIYLRKSRADAEAEAKGEGETLARHKAILLEFAKNKNIPISAIYEEITSGETISARPVVKQLLSEVEKGFWQGVLVMEIERLARGDTIDQGIIARTFQYSGTKIITPQKTYDTNNIYDQEYFEFSLFMSRREYQTINRRLQQGRLASVKEGKFVGSVAPYGYKKIRIAKEKGFLLSPISQEADIVKAIYHWYLYGYADETGKILQAGTTLIANKLNSMGILSKTGKKWSASSVRDILKNPVYIGKIRWQYRPSIKKLENGNILSSRCYQNTSYTLVKGLHKPIISQEVFQQVQNRMKSHHNAPIAKSHTIKNPLAGIVICGVCQKHMVRRPYQTQQDLLVCPTSGCATVGCCLSILEKRILDVVEYCFSNTFLPWEKFSPSFAENTSLLTFQKQKLSQLLQQKNTIYTLLEQGVYSPELFQQRLLEIEKQIAHYQSQIRLFCSVSEQKTPSPSKNILDLYNQMPNAKGKNELLKQIFSSIIYQRQSGGRWQEQKDNFKLSVFLKLPFC
mgnify:FL=1